MLDNDWDAGQVKGKALIGTDWGTTIYIDDEDNLNVQPGSANDGDGEWWFVNSDGDTALIDMDHNPRAFYVQHHSNGLLWLTSWDSWRTNTNVNDNLIVR